MTTVNTPASRQLQPADLRKMLGSNLRLLCKDTTSISALCRQLGINRTQFNRYLSGESFPRPDVLYRICSHFGVDARILLEPLHVQQPNVPDLLSHPQIAGFVGANARNLEEDRFPSGIYRFSRPSFLPDTDFVQGLVRVFRDDGYTFIRGLEAREAMRRQGMPIDRRGREFRGFVLPQEDGLAALISRRGALTCTFNFLSRVPSFQNNFWVGYATRTQPESVTGKRFLPEWSTSIWGRTQALFWPRREVRGCAR